jgi:hypothetical protein
VNETVPLAGYMAAFFAIIYCISFFVEWDSILAY